MGRPLAYAPLPVERADQPGVGSRGARLTVVVHGFRRRAGWARVALFRGPEGFPERREAAERTASAPVDADALEFCFEGLEPGTWALAVLHDGNGDGRLGRNLLGIPTDGYAVSSVTRYALRSPRFDEASFELSADERRTIVLRLHYLL